MKFRILIALSALLFLLIGVQSQLVGQSLVKDDFLEEKLENSAYAEAFVYGKNQYELAFAAKDTLQQIYYLLALIDIHMVRGEHDAGREKLNRIFELYSEELNKDIKASIWMSISYVNYNLGSIDLALEFVEQVMDYCREVSDPLLESGANSLYGTIFLMNGNLEKANKYLTHALELSASNETLRRFRIRDMLLLGLFELISGKPDSSKVYIETAETLALELEDTVNLARIKVFEAAWYKVVGQLDNWEKSIKHAIQIGEKNQLIPIISSAYIQLIEKELAQKNYPVALEYGEKAMLLVKKERMPVIESYLDSLMYVLYYGLGDSDRALDYFSEFYKNKKKVISAQHLEAAMQINFLAEIKEKNLFIENQRLKLISVRRRSFLLGLAVVTLAIIILATWLLRSQHASFVSRLYRKEVEVEKFFPDNLLKDKPLAPASFKVEGEADLVDERNLLFRQFNTLMKEQKLYLDPELNQQVVVSLLSTNKRYLYEAISQNSNYTYSELVNLFRVNEAKQIMRQNYQAMKDPLANKELYTNAGFNSLSSFYRAFKNFTGMTPKEFAKEFEKSLEK